MIPRRVAFQDVPRRVIWHCGITRTLMNKRLMVMLLINLQSSIGCLTYLNMMQYISASHFLCYS